MRHRSRTLGALCAVVIAATLLIPSPGAQAQETYTVQVGADFGRRFPGFSSRFYPTSIKVRAGDLIHFEGAPGLFLPVGTGPTEFREDNMNDVGDPYFPFAFDPDEGPDALKLNFAMFDPSSDCGQDAATACHFLADPTEPLLNSGDQARDFFVTIDANPGSTIWVVQLFGTRGTFRIDVVAGEELPSTQAQLDAQADRLERQDFDTAHSLWEKFSTKQTSHKRKDGTRVWDAWGGIDQGPVNLLAFFPKKLTIDKGDIVQWHFPLENEIHSGAFPLDDAKGMTRNNFESVCDIDGDEGTAPDEPANPDAQSAEDACADPAQAEVDLDPLERAAARGDGSFTGNKDFEYSGLRVAESITGGYGSEVPWNVRFQSKSPKGGWDYWCTFHGGFMAGTVIVN